MTEQRGGVLERIVARRRESLYSGGWDEVPPPSRPSRWRPFLPRENRFLAALMGEARLVPSTHAVIAEIKMGSPKLGSLAGRFDPLEQAELYAHYGAAALSVVVEPDFFHGSYKLLTACHRESGLPAIAKDFVVDPRQLEWARAAGADAVLLIAAIYDREELHDWAARARGLGLAPLIEVHDAGDLEKLNGAQWELVGINNRDLRTFDVDLERSIELRARIPDGALVVAESGIDRGEQVTRLAAAGFDAFLIGESLLLAESPGAKLAELAG